MTYEHYKLLALCGVIGFFGIAAIVAVCMARRNASVHEPSNSFLTRIGQKK